MAKDVYQSDYYKKRGGVLPLRWMAPEALTDGKHTVKSDIWSFGVLMWEVFSYGYQPYFGVDNEVVLAGVIGRYMVLQCPPGCPEIVYHLMKRCWERRPEDRISASKVSKQLLGLAEMCKDNGFDAVKQLTADNYEKLQASNGSSAEGASNRYVTMLSTATEEDDGYLKPAEVVKTMDVNTLSTFSNLPKGAAENIKNRNTAKETVSSDDRYVHMIQPSPQGGAVEATQRKAILNNTSSQKDSITAFVGVVEEPRYIDMHAEVSRGSLRGRSDPASSNRELHSTAVGAQIMPQYIAMADGEAKDASVTTVL
jgi:serine/threonine protein kinase